MNRRECVFIGQIRSLFPQNGIFISIKHSHQFLILKGRTGNFPKWNPITLLSHLITPLYYLITSLYYQLHSNHQSLKSPQSYHPKMMKTLLSPKYLPKESVNPTAKRQEIVSLSTTKSEYITITHASKEALWLRSLITQLFNTVLKPTTLFSDNQSAIALTKDHQYHPRSKHICYDFVYFYYHLFLLSFIFVIFYLG